MSYKSSPAYEAFHTGGTTMPNNDVIPGLTITPGPGRYLVSFAAHVTSTAGTTQILRLRVNATIVATAVQGSTGAGTLQGCVAATRVVDVADGEAIDVYGAFSGSAGTVNNACLTVTLVG